MKMHKAYGTILAVVVFLAHAAGAGYKQINTPDPGDPMAVRIFELDNGLRVYITENHEAPRFYAEIAVRAGSKNDPPETTGLAHYFEHLMFKGTRQMGTLDFAKEKPHLDRIEELYEAHFRETDPAKRAAIYAQIDAENQEAATYAVPNEIDRVYKAMGGDDVNAHTWYEETVYQVELPANRFEQWAAIESDRFTNPVFRLFPTELETVYEEKNQSLDNKMRIIQEAVDALLYKRHPYGQETVLGRPEHLKNPSLRNITAFFDAWYVPNNMAIAISGDIDTDRAIRTIDQYFSGWQARKLPKSGKWKEKKLNGREFVSVNYQAEEFVLLAFRTVKNGHRDADALLLMDMILDNATAGLINLNLNQMQKVRQAGSFPMQHNDYGAQYFYGVPKDGQSLEEVEKLLLEQIELVKQGEFEDWIFPAIINDFKKQRKAALESDSARVGLITRAYIAREPWEHAVDQIRRMEKITKGDIVRVARRYFQGDYVAGYRRDAPHDVPNVAKPALTSVEIDPTRQSAFATQIMAMPCTPIEPVYVVNGKDYQKIEDPRGITTYYVPNPINDVFTFTLSVDFGTYEDNTIAAAVKLLEKSGTERLSPEDLKKEWYKLGTDFGVAVSDNETSVTLTGLDENFEASLALLMELLKTPAAQSEILEELKKIILVERADAKKQAESIAGALVQFNRYGSDSYFLRMLPEAQLKALTVEQLHGVIKNLLGYKHSVSYTGTLSPERIQTIMRKWESGEHPLQDPPPYCYRKARSPERTEVYYFPKEMAQAHVRLEFGAADYDAARNPAVQLYNNYFAGGMAGIVFQELREARALAYYAGARYITGYRAKDQDLMAGAIMTQADKTTDAVSAFMDLLDNLPISEERFAIARESLINQYRTGKIGFREISNAVRNWERHGLFSDPRPVWFKAIQSSTLQTVLDFHREYIAGKSKLISIVGDMNKINKDALQSVGPLKEVALTDIFVD